MPREGKRSVVNPMCELDVHVGEVVVETGVESEERGECGETLYSECVCVPSMKGRGAPF